MSNNKKNVAKKVKSYKTYWKRRKRWSLSSARVCSKRKDLKLYWNSAHRIKPEMSNTWHHWIIFYKIWRKWSILRRIIWNLLLNNWSLVRHSMKSNRHYNKREAKIEELLSNRLKSTSKKRWNSKIKSKTSSRLYGKTFKIKRIRLKIL